MEELNYKMIPSPSEGDIQVPANDIPALGEAKRILIDEVKMSDEDILKQWVTLRITTKTDVPPLEPAIMVDDVGVFTRRDIHGIKAKQKY